MLILENSEKVANSTKLQKQVNENCTERREKHVFFHTLELEKKKKWTSLTTIKNNYS